MSVVLLLRQRGRLTAQALATELEVSTRTILRDIEALSAAGVPVYAERGRHGGFCLLPGFRTELTGLSHDEALALMSAQAASGEQLLGLGAALASARRKVLDALPESDQLAANDGAQRLLVDPETDLLARRATTDHVPDGTLTSLRRAVLAGRRLSIHYASRGQPPRWQTLDPIGLVTVRGKGYLLATEDGADRTLRFSRILAARELPEPAQRPAQVDLRRVWAQRCDRFLSEGHIPVRLLVHPVRRDDLLDMVEAVRAEQPEAGGWLDLEVTFQDLWHAEWALWQLGTQAEALSPGALRASLQACAQALADRYREP